MKKIITLAFVSVLLFNCNHLKTKNYSALEKKQMKTKKHPGKKLMETNCYTCHSPTAKHDDRIGPPMIAVKKHYINENTTKAEFNDAIQAWIKNPNEEDAKMFGAVRRFGVMPKQSFPEEAIKQITDFMFDYDIEQPEWIEEHFNEEKGKLNTKGMGKGRGH